MTVCIMEMPSYTYAVKGERLLRSKGISCELKRNVKVSPGGCGYSLHIRGSAERAAAVLKGFAVPFTVIDSGGG